jgi:hypothetical protein
MATKQAFYALCVSRSHDIAHALLNAPARVVAQYPVACDDPAQHGNALCACPITGEGAAITLAGDTSNVTFLSCGYLPRIEGAPRVVAPILRAFLDGILATRMADGNVKRAFRDELLERETAR